MLTEVEIQRLEAAARVIHADRHRMGTGSACDRCRALAREVASVLWADPDAKRPPADA